ncbi:putative ccr4-not transcription complex subunit 7 protein [Venturia nashicola]|uniref:poly(A)-specific ribonuclease n=1 Tax=Venturia nashicola TaxID=86259 RepID=A0A4Z1NY39_9PEZI|nr:putative ccr4-not transcription complex subunit 7 protein [Venturia nashicola]TLD30189.1 putative ccr4-not transcription complex subunit 7 protein [Venturia nashicola]
MPNTRYPPHNTSNPFAGFTQPAHLQHPNAQHNLGGGHPTFAASAINGMNIFGPQTGNGGVPMFNAVSSLGGSGGGETGLGSREAQLNFARGAALQQQAIDAANPGSFPARATNTRVREVWQNNLQQEFAVLRQLVDKYPYISMDTEFPGIVARPIGDFVTKASYHYQTLRANVDLLKIIQLGITLFNVEGKEVPTTALRDAKAGKFQNNVSICPCSWSFNFKFSPEEDMYNEESLTLLKKAGSDFDAHATRGIDIRQFGSLLVTSGLIYSDNVHWISFHSGYDFGYLAKVIWNKPLPKDEEGYREIIRIIFPNIWDVKYLLKHSQHMIRRGTLNVEATRMITELGSRSGLQDLADQLGCQRIGTQHQAASDAWLTGSVFWHMRDKFFDGNLPEELNGQMWGLTGVGLPASTATQAAVLAAQGHASATGVQNGGNQFGPSTPTTHSAGLASTPGPGSGANVYPQSMTPGGGNGNFGTFTYGK